jgi:hypothetical protein
MKAAIEALNAANGGKYNRMALRSRLKTCEGLDRRSMASDKYGSCTKIDAVAFFSIVAHLFQTVSTGERRWTAVIYRVV